CVIANRLAEDPEVNVLVLEAGYSDDIFSSRTPGLAFATFKTPCDWGYRTVPQEHAGGRSLLQPRGKMLGGSSSINAMIYHRGVASDFDHWEELGNPGWSYKDVLPYFRKSERFNASDSTSQLHNDFTTYEPEYHGTDGLWQVSNISMFKVSEKFLRAGEAEGISLNKDLNGTSPLGANKAQTFIRKDGVRSSLARAFLREDVVPGGKNGRVLRRVEASREVLLSAGTYASPQILIASGIGPAPQASIPHIHTLPGVGANLQDHLFLPLVYKVNRKCATIQGNMDPWKAFKEILKYTIKGTGTMTSNLAEALIFMRLEDMSPEFVTREKANGTYIERASGPTAPHVEFIIIPGYARAQGEAMAPDKENYITLSVALLNPGSVGSIKVVTRQAEEKNCSTECTNEKASSSQSQSRIVTEPVIDPNYLADPFDVRVFAESLRFLRKIGRRLGQDPEVEAVEVYPGEAKVPDDDEEALQKYARENTETVYHPVSTCKMGPPTDPMAVVDPELKVYGINHLRVIDASVFPKIVAGHTCPPTVMIAEKACDLIKVDWKSSAPPSYVSTDV
ncbi:hypothetical protein BX616_004860, partial [Lobosporangium transversale]